MDLAQDSFGFRRAPVALLVTQDRLISACNARFAEMFGYAETELIGRMTAILYPSQREFVEIGRVGHMSMRADGAYEDERIMKRRDNSLFWCRAQGSAENQDQPFKLCVWSFETLSSFQTQLNLTRREREVALHLTNGLSTKEIARKLERSPKTVDIFRSNLLKKFGARNVAELVAIFSRGM